MEARAAGKALDVLLKRGICVSEAWGQLNQPVVLTDLQGKGLCGKEAFLLS